MAEVKSQILSAGTSSVIVYNPLWNIRYTLFFLFIEVHIVDDYKFMLSKLFKKKGEGCSAFVW